MRGIDSIFTEDDRQIGAETHASSTPKLIKSANTNERKVIPGHVNDFIFQNDKRKTEFDADILCEEGWINSRIYNNVSKKYDRSQPAVATFDETTVPNKITRVI